MKIKNDVNPEWFDIQYCMACGILGHVELECEKRVIPNDNLKLLYDIKLRALEMKKKKFQSFAEASAESYGSGIVWKMAIGHCL